MNVNRNSRGFARVPALAAVWLLSAVLCISAWADATNEVGYSTTYLASGQTYAGSIQGQVTNAVAKWSPYVPISPNIPQRVINLGTNAHSGEQTWFTVNKGQQGSFGNMPYSPAIRIVATEPSATNFAGADMMEGTVWFRSASTTADGTRVEMDMGRIDRSDRGNATFVEFVDDVGQTLRIRTSQVRFDASVPIFTRIQPATWHEFRFVAQFIDGQSNNLMQFFLDGQPSTNVGPFGLTNVWEDYEKYAQPNVLAVDCMFFRTGQFGSSVLNEAGTTNFTLDSPQGIYFDDLSYRVFSSTNPARTLASYSTAFELFAVRKPGVLCVLK